MKNIITAINNPKINEELKINNKFNIIGKDIQYKEGIIDALENNKNKNINLIIINPEIPGEIKTEKIIEKIIEINSKIKIIIIIENNNLKINKKIIENNNLKIYYSKIELNKIINIITEKEIKNNKNKIVSINNIKKTNKNILINLLVYYLTNNNKNILVIKNKLKKEKTKKSQELITIKSIKEIIRIEKDQKIENGIEKNLEIYKEKYEYIIVDISYLTNEKIKRVILRESDEIILLIEGNILGIRGLIRFIEKYVRSKIVNENSLHIVENKYNKNSIDKKIIEVIVDKKMKVYNIKYYKKNSIDITKRLSKNKKVEKEIEKMLNIKR